MLAAEQRDDVELVTEDAAAQRWLGGRLRRVTLALRRYVQVSGHRLTARQMAASLDWAATRAARALRLSGSGLRALSFAAVIG
jgi:hypothetical protein